MASERADYFLETIERIQISKIMTRQKKHPPPPPPDEGPPPPPDLRGEAGAPRRYPPALLRSLRLFGFIGVVAVWAAWDALARPCGATPFSFS